MAHVVEGDWKNFTFKMLTADDFPAVSKHLRSNFYIHEPLSIATGLSEAKYRDLDNIILNILKENLSFGATEKDTGKVAGVAIILRLKKGEDDFPTLESDEMKITLNFLGDVDKAANLFERYEVDEIADFFIASVEEKFRGQGLASELYRRSIPYLKELNFVAMTSAFTSPYTRLIGKKFGFDELARRNYREIEKLNGDLMCPAAGDDEFIVVTGLKL